MPPTVDECVLKTNLISVSDEFKIGSHSAIGAVPDLIHTSCVAPLGLHALAYKAHRVSGFLTTFASTFTAVTLDAAIGPAAGETAAGLDVASNAFALC